jgi:hypothetical protein
VSLSDVSSDESEFHDPIIFAAEDINEFIVDSTLAALSSELLSSPKVPVSKLAHIIVLWRKFIAAIVFDVSISIRNKTTTN